MAGTDDPWHHVIERWRRGKLAIRPGASAAAITEFESTWSVVLPRDVREYFATVDGMKNGVMDDDGFRFWPLAEVEPVHEELTSIHPDRQAYPDCFLLADYMIWCWGYAVRLTGDRDQPAPVFLVTGGQPHGGEVAPSFRDFLVRYADDPGSVIRA